MTASNAYQTIAAREVRVCSSVLIDLAAAVILVAVLSLRILHCA